MTVCSIDSDNMTYVGSSDFCPTSSLNDKIHHLHISSMQFWVRSQCSNTCLLSLQGPAFVSAPPPLPSPPPSPPLGHAGCSSKRGLAGDCTPIGATDADGRASAVGK